MGLMPPPPSLLEGASLFLDLDGTLVEFADAPANIRVDDSLRDVLRNLNQKLEGRLAIISGRGLDDLIEHLGIDDLSLAGSHGLEFRIGGEAPLRPTRPPELDEAVGKVRAFAEARGLIVEAKPAGVALHYRSDPARGEETTAFAAALARDCNLKVQLGSMVAELRAPGPDKGTIIRRFMAEPLFAAGSPVAVGDDLTDEDAFAAAIDLGGHAVLVGAERPTAARFRLADVEAARRWLKQAL